MNTTGTLSLFLLTFILLIAAIRDVCFHKIPNRLTYPAMVAALIFHVCTNGTNGLLFSLKGIGLGIAILAIPYLLGGMGAGDVKLLGVVGGFLGPVGVVAAFLGTAVVGGIYAMTLLILHKQQLKKMLLPCLTIIYPYALKYNFLLCSDKNQKKPRLYYGVAIAFGTILSICFRIPSLIN